MFANQAATAIDNARLYTNLEHRVAERTAELEVARHRDLEVRLLDRRTSGDTAGDSQRVVGYASFALYSRD